MTPRSTLRACLAASLVWSAACDVSEPTNLGDEADVQLTTTAVPPPAPLVTVSDLEFWPYTARTLGSEPTDPMNVLFPNADVRSLRAALMMLDGDRTAFGFPAAPPFDCTWKESMGSNQASYSTPSGWTGSAIQLECGDYAPIRFHIRMFPAGDWTIANAHFEVLIQGTNEHEVLSWELAEQLVTVDFVRTGLLAAAPTATGIINDAPTFRAINPLVYNGLPDALKALTGGPPVATDPVPMPNDGLAQILSLAGPVAGQRSVAKREFVLQFDQTIPKPFCVQSPLDFLDVTGPIHFSQHVVVSANGNFMSQFKARGGLELIPINPLTQVTGDPLMARVAEHDKSVVTDDVTLVSTLQMQLILPRNDPASGSLRATLRIGPGGSDGATLDITCSS